jgi:hypothetical protein
MATSLPTYQCQTLGGTNRPTVSGGLWNPRATGISARSQSPRLRFHGLRTALMETCAVTLAVVGLVWFGWVALCLIA